jgi:hypothetical protein
MRHAVFGRFQAPGAHRRLNMIGKKCNPKPDARGLSRSKIKDLALEQFLLAYAKGERTGHVESEDLDIAFEMAQEALPGAYESIG